MVSNKCTCVLGLNPTRPFCSPNDSHKSLDEGFLGSAAVFFDLSKAFDTEHTIYCLKTVQYWHLRFAPEMVSQLFVQPIAESCHQRTVLSLFANADSDVTQGSILGPFLFTFYLNSIFDLQLTLNSKITLYADDVKLYELITTFKHLWPYSLMSSPIIGCFSAMLIMCCKKPSTASAC